jgi:signal transduction histidine kinase
VTAVLTLVTYAGIQIARRQLESNLRETARVTAVAISDEIELNDNPFRRDLLPLLRTFMSAAVDLDAIYVFRVENGTPVIVANTSVVERPPEALVQRAVATGEPTWSDTGHGLATVAIPIFGGDVVTGGVAVAVSLGALEQFSRAVTIGALVGGIMAIAGITLLILLLARRLILEPVGAIRSTIADATGGNLAARATVTDEHELKDVADGLNAMLTELEDLHASLTQRVAAATGELRQRNEQLVHSYESVLQLREAAARAEQLAAVGQTMANVAHQIGTPLNLVSGHVQLLQQEVADPVLRRRLTIVEEQITRVVSAVRDLLQRARPHAEAHVVDLGTALRRLSEAMRIRLGTAGVRLDTQIAEDLPAVMADETQLELALLNLLTNAVDAMPRGGTLTLRAEPLGPRVRITIRDTGVGIPADVLPKIFEPWVTTKAAGRGTGLGLSITRDVVTRLGGTITASSGAGAGTTFTIDIPVASDATVQQS